MRDALKEERFSLLGSVKNISDSEASDRDEDDVCHGRPSSRKSTKVGSKNKTGSMSVPNKIQSGLVGSMSASASASIDEEEREVRAMTESIRNGVKRISNAHIPFAGQAVRLIEEFNGRMSPFFSRSSEDRFSKSSSKNIRRPDHVIGNESVEDEEGSLFGQSNGASNVWVQCDRCAKWRRLRGAVDSKKLPSKWFCTMNKSDPERARCSAPEEEYHDVPESAEENRTRKHLRLWVRRLKGYEAYEAKMPTMTRGKKKSVTIGSKEPYEWVRCCNPSCGKWRAILRFMDASDIMESTRDKDWYCVLNTWDEKTASCSAPQENLPATGCPPWVMKDEK
uniref:CW-type domain-containing protein n=1 Tax=Corethron hystrix TaxID=216773 RepID=A0A7S1C0T6_9STRA|mmetsp:Transcript_9633/g.21389  ORF Transcript_9633/g.21389 Transcript_9633/m.21389 type:complete len:337 (+) Transcript_9633:786-1796(+)